MIDVSVILVTYNSKWDDIRTTLISILKQKNISLQIIVADDGSKKTYDDKIKELMNQYSFKEYLFRNSPVNNGTVLNIINSIKYIKGKYTKLISPGDRLFDETTLYKWIDFMSSDNIEISFGDAVYYSKSEGLRLHKTKGAPINRYLYKKLKYSEKQFVDYVVANDTVLGAAQLMKSDILVNYLGLIQNKIIYAEDYMIRIMVYDGLNVMYYPNIVIWYEYGTGISTSKNNKWEKILKVDFEASNDLIAKRKVATFAQKKYKMYLKLRKIRPLGKVVKVLLFPSVIVCRINARFAKKDIFLKETEPTAIEQKFCWIDK